jgi:hypothetical protein
VFVFGSGNTNRPEMIYRDFSALISLFLKIIPNSQAKNPKKKNPHTGVLLFFLTHFVTQTVFTPNPSHTQEKNKLSLC